MPGEDSPSTGGPGSERAPIGNRRGTLAAIATAYTYHTNPITGATLVDRGVLEPKRRAPEMIVQMMNYNFKGYARRSDSGTLAPAYAFTRLGDLVGVEWQKREVAAAIEANSIVSKQAGDGIGVTTDNFLENYVTTYVRVAVNLRNFLSLLRMGQSSDALTSLVVGGSLGAGGRFTRATNLLDRFQRVMIPDFWRQRAVALAGVFGAGAADPYYVMFIVNSAQISTLGLKDERAKMVDMNVNFAKDGAPLSLWADALLKDAETSIQQLDGLIAVTDVSAWKEDVERVHDIWRLNNRGVTGVPEPLETAMMDESRYASLVSHRPWMWAEEKALPNLDEIILVPNETVPRAFLGSLDTNWVGGFGVHAGYMGSDPNVDVTKTIGVLGELDPFTSPWLASPPKDGIVAISAEAPGNIRPEPVYMWYARSRGWVPGMRGMDDAMLTNTAFATKGGISKTAILPYEDPLFTRNVYLYLAAESKALAAGEKVEGYPTGRSPGDSFVEHSEEDIADSWLRRYADAMPGGGV